MRKLLTSLFTIVLLVVTGGIENNWVMSGQRQNTAVIINSEKPVRGYWRGDNVEFTVSSDGSHVCGLTIWWYSYEAPCFLTGWGSYDASQIDANDTFSYEIGHRDIFNRYDSLYVEGIFTSNKTANGTWRVKSNRAGYNCSKSGVWGASFATGEPFNCNQIGSVEICAWVNKPDPTPNENVVVYCQLLDGGVGQDGLQMQTVWHFENETVTREEQTGSAGPGLAIFCQRASDPPKKVGYTVTIDVTTVYNDQTYVTSTSFTPRSVTAITHFDSEERLDPRNFQLKQNFPNPFNSQTIIEYRLPKQSEVRLEIYNIVGKSVKTVVNERQTAGQYSVLWDGKDALGRDLPSGVYIYRLQTNEFVKVKKFILIR